MKNRRDHREILALSLVPQVGKQRIRYLLDAFPDAGKIFHVSAEELQQVKGIGPETASAIAAFHGWEEVERLLEKGQQDGIHLISISDSIYPPLLREIHDAPVLLWVAGNPNVLTEPSIALVGTRRPDRYGREQAVLWARRLTEAGITVLSGLALGIDTLAHQEVLDRSGRAVAVLGSSLDRLYPSENRTLARKILNRGGAVCSEYPPGTVARPNHFPVRNRIVSGLGFGVLIVQSGIRGGSMITARTALDQNREVFVIPHSLDRRSGGGNHELIRSGQGKLVEQLEDLLEEIPCRSTASHRSAGRSDRQPELSEVNRNLPQDESGGRDLFRLNRTLSPTRCSFSDALSRPVQTICSLLADGEYQLDQLSEQSGYPVRKLLPILMELELQGAVRQRSGRLFSLVNKQDVPPRLS